MLVSVVFRLGLLVRLSWFLGLVFLLLSLVLSLLGLRLLVFGLGCLGRGIADASDYFAHVHGVILVGQNFDQGACYWGRDFSIDLVGGDLEQWLVDLDRVARLLEPLGNGAFGDGFAELWHDYVFGLTGAGLGSLSLCSVVFGRTFVLVRGLICGFRLGGFLGGSFIVVRVRIVAGIRTCLVLIANLGDHGAHVHRVIFIGDDLQQNTGHRGWDFGIHLVRGDFQQRLIDLDLVTNLLEPLGHSAFCYGLAQFGHFDGMRHGLEAPRAYAKISCSRIWLKYYISVRPPFFDSGQLVLLFYAKHTPFFAKSQILHSGLAGEHVEKRERARID